MLSKDELKHLAKLARLEIGEEELEKFQRDISRIVEFVGELQKLNTRAIKEEREPRGLESVFREDQERGLVGEKGQELIEHSPQRRDELVVVPEVFKES